MSVLATTRINLAPTVRTLASGVPLAPRINFAVGSSGAHDDHGSGGSAIRHDAPPKWASSGGRSMMLTRQNAPVTPIHSRRMIHSMASAIPNNKGSSSAHSVPDFKPYLAKSANSNRSLQYFMVGSMGLLAAAGAKATVTDILANMAASADVLALAKIEVEMASIPEGKNLIAKWRGKPVFIRHRTPDEIKEAESVDVKSLRDPQTDADRVQQPEWLVMLGVCTHLGCVPIGEAGDYGGWFCPCHGSHYDISGRIRKGPAPLNLEVPEYSFSDDEKIIIG